MLSQLLFPLIAVAKFVWKDKPFVNFLCPPFSYSFPDRPQPVREASAKELELEVELRFFHCIFQCFSLTKEVLIETLCSVSLDFRKSHLSAVPEFVAVGQNDNGILLGEWPKLT